MIYVVIILIGYFLGNISSSYLVGKLGRNIDVRRHGSGNLGATNVYRVMGLKAGAIVFIGDMLKGLFAALIGLLLLRGDGMGALIGGMAAVLGHNWPILLNFRGGKGVASSFGAILVLFPGVALIVFAIWGILIALTGYVSLASVIAASLVPILAIVFGYKMKYVIGAIIFAALIIFRHRDNISRLLKGKESKISRRGSSRRLK
ncbi:MAG: glycerol-3-phosphate 1-O-acyltransferase PlsY [Clostridiales bacterium]|nr:glycerol-3-phosphate 1-O-acyltransferase PlsY [Clostridiales bacterium]